MEEERKKKLDENRSTRNQKKIFSFQTGQTTPKRYKPPPKGTNQMKKVQTRLKRVKPDEKRDKPRSKRLILGSPSMSCWKISQRNCVSRS